MTDLKPLGISIEAAAARLGTSRRTLQGIIRQHPFYHQVGRKKLFDDEDIRALWSVLRPCPSASSASPEAPTSTSAAPSAASVYTRLQALRTRLRRKPSGSRKRPNSSTPASMASASPAPSRRQP